MRGTCNVTSGECMCNADWIGLQCEIRPSAVYWDTECGCFKSDGCEVYGLDENGGALTGCTHLTEFGMMSETVEPPGMDGGVTLKVNLPKVMTLEELLETLADMKPLEIAIPISWFCLQIFLFYLCRKYDDSKAYVAFFPTWHEYVAGGRTTSTLVKILGAQLVVVICTNHFLAVLFILPTLPFGRSMRLMTVFVILHGQLATMALFYGGQEGDLAKVMAQAIDIGVIIVLQNLSVQTFMFALVKKSDLGEVQAMVEKTAQRQRARQKWVLALRQTVPKSKAMAAKAMASWRGDDVLLLQNSKAPQYYDPHTLLRKVEEFRDVRSGKFELMLKVWKRGDVSVSVWKQKNALNDQVIAGFEPVKVHRLHRHALKGLRQGAAATWDDDQPDDVQLDSDGRDISADAPILSGTVPGDRTRAFQLGSPELNRFRGIIGWEDSFAGTVHKVELYVRNPHFRPKRTLVDKVRGRNRPPRKENAMKGPANPFAPDKPKVSLAAKGRKLLHKVVKIFNKEIEVPDTMMKSKMGANELINKVCGVPACALIRQPDGTVGFFVETQVATCDDPRSAIVRTRIKPGEEAAAAREIAASKEVQIKHLAKKLMAVVEAVQLKFEEESRVLRMSRQRDTEALLSKLRAQRDNDMVNLEAQVLRVRFEPRRAHMRAYSVPTVCCCCCGRQRRRSR